MDDRDLIIEVCHDLINRALRNEYVATVANREDTGWHNLGNEYAKDDRAKEAAIRRMLAENETMRKALKEIAEHPGPAYPSAQACFRAIENGMDAAYRACTEIAKKALK